MLGFYYGCFIYDLRVVKRAKERAARPNKINTFPAYGFLLFRDVACSHLLGLDFQTSDLRDVPSCSKHIVPAHGTVALTNYHDGWL